MINYSGIEDIAAAIDVSKEISLLSNKNEKLKDYLYVVLVFSGIGIFISYLSIKKIKQQHEKIVE